MQNEMIDSLGEQIQDTIVNEIKKAGIFSILADEMSDISRKEQLAISLRYVNSEGIIQEKLSNLLNPILAPLQWQLQKKSRLPSQI